MKALILAGGRGKRLGELSGHFNKSMLEFAGKPVLEYNLERAAELDIGEIILLVGYRAEEIINRYGTNYRGKKIKYVIQWEQKGLVHAIETAKEAIGKDSFFLLLGDEVLVNSRHKEMLRAFMCEDIFVMCGVMFQKDKEKTKRTYTVSTDDEGRVFRLVEKPKKVFGNWQGTGHCVFKNEIISYIERTPIYPDRGEKELPDLIQCAVDDGHVVKIFDICDEYTNINSEDQLKEAAEMLAVNTR